MVRFINSLLYLLPLCIVDGLPSGGIPNYGVVSIGGVLNKQSKITDILNIFSGRLPGREEAVLESPSFQDQKNLIYDYAQQVMANIFQSKPIIDTIAEHEKYGNAGDQFRPIGNAIVNGYEGFSNFLNSAIDLPFESMKTATRKASSFLSSVGAKLVGL